MLVELLEYGARELLPSWERGLLGLIASAAGGSEPWMMLLALAPMDIEHVLVDGDEATAVVARALAHRAPVRDDGDGDGDRDEPRLGLTLPEAIRGEHGTVDIDRLVQAVRGEHAEARASQRDMVGRMRASMTPPQQLLIEAPTGVGKSYAILTVALEWLAADPDHRVVVSTFTKQLQGQLAEDIERLDEKAVPGLVAISDMVKGARNRLSLRGLVVTLADLTQPERPRAGRRRRRSEFADDPRFRDLVIYLALRFIGEGKPTEMWEARSVDRVDIPAFFDDYCPRRLGLYLASLSQADAGEYEPGRGEIARQTATVNEALRDGRLVIANHALLLAHLRTFKDLGEGTLLIVDEAHELENAATGALGATIESGRIEKLVADTRDWLSDQGQGEGLASLEQTARAVDLILDDARVYRAALQAFDRAEADPLGRAQLRTITVASPVQGDAHVEPMEHLTRELREVYRELHRLTSALRDAPAPVDLFQLDRLAGLRTSATELRDGLRQILDGIDAVLAPVSPTPGNGAGSSNELSARIDAGNEDGLDPELVSVDAGEAPIDPDGNGAEAPMPDERVWLPNRVVWTEEVEALRPGSVRDYRFAITSSPINLGQEDGWRDFLGLFERLYLVSATLRVAESWDFIRERLGLDTEVTALALPSPFDPAQQARLVCFEDFPSWAEHTEAATRTIGHQLGGYAGEFVATSEDDRSWRNGALVLTTSRAAAAGIFDELARYRVRSNQTFPLISAGLEGNQSAVETFKRIGGVVVGTRGLWQGVDVENAERLRIVWINKLPFASFTDPVIGARREVVRQRAEAAGADDPDAVANEAYYLPLAALSLRQAVGRLIRSQAHRGVVIISDRKLAGPTRLRHLYRRIFLGSLDPGFLIADS